MRTRVRLRVLTGAAIVLTAALILQAQVPQRPTSESNAQKDVEAVANALGMLRGLQLRDAIATMEYWATGSMSVPAQVSRPGAARTAYTITNYHASIAYDVPGMRVEVESAHADAPAQATNALPLTAAQKQILVVSGAYAWNESEPGAGLVPGKGTVTRAMAAWAERYLELWMMPHAFVKAARMPNAPTKVAVENGMTVVTTVVPGMPQTMMKAWINAKNLIDRVEARVDNRARGDTVIEAAYSDYKDIGGTEIPSDVLFPGRIVRKVGGDPVLDITVTKGNTYNPYVIMPVPETVEKTRKP